MPEQFSEKKRQAGSKDKKEPLCQGYSVPENTGAVGVKNFDSKYKTGVRTIECQKKAQRESKSKRIGIHTCFQASTETPDLDDVAVPNSSPKLDIFIKPTWQKSWNVSLLIFVFLFNSFSYSRFRDCHHGPRFGDLFAD